MSQKTVHVLHELSLAKRDQFYEPLVTHDFVRNVDALSLKVSPHGCQLVVFKVFSVGIIRYQELL